MRKIILVSMLVIFVNSVFCVELWNGFTTDMSVDEALTKTNELFTFFAEANEWEKDDGWNLLPLGMRNYSIPRKGLRTIFLYANMDGLIKEVSKSRFYSGFYPNIVLTFFNNKLFAISVTWDANRNDVLNIARKRFGNPTVMEKYIETFGRPDEEIPMWRLSGKDLFVKSSSFTYIDQKTRTDWINEKNRIEQQRKEEEERKQREKASKIIF